MSEPKHSPLPWAKDDDGYITAEFDGVDMELFQVAEWATNREVLNANAEFIVTACNSYYGMRKALQAASSALGPMENLINPDLRALKAQIEENL